MIAVYGAGAVGLGLGSALLAAGERVQFATRDAASARALRSLGVRRSGIFGTLRIAGEALLAGAGAASLREAPEPLEWILVCTKTTDAAEAARDLASVAATLRGTPSIVLCQNGWGGDAPLLATWPRERLFHARVITGFRREGPGRVEVTVHAAPVRIGSRFGVPAARVAPLCAAIERGGIPCLPSTDIESELWAKLLYNCALNPLAALLDAPYGALAQAPAARAIVEGVVHEIFEVMERSGHRTQWRDAAQYLPVLWRELLPPTAQHESSMLQDLRAGRRTEIGALCGAVVALAARHGVDAPLNAALTTLVRAREAPAKPPRGTV